MSDRTVKDFKVGDDIETHPATDAWMQGDRFGTVSKLGMKYVYVDMHRSGKTRKFLPGDLIVKTEVGDHD